LTRPGQTVASAQPPFGNPLAAGNGSRAAAVLVAALPMVACPRARATRR